MIGLVLALLGLVVAAVAVFNLLGFMAVGAPWPVLIIVAAVLLILSYAFRGRDLP